MERRMSSIPSPVLTSRLRPSRECFETAVQGQSPTTAEPADEVQVALLGL